MPLQLFRQHLAGSDYYCRKTQSRSLSPNGGLSIRVSGIKPKPGQVWSPRGSEALGALGGAACEACSRPGLRLLLLPLGSPPFARSRERRGGGGGGGRGGGEVQEAERWTAAGGGGGCRLGWLNAAPTRALDFPGRTAPLRPGVTPSAHGPGWGQPAGGAEEAATGGAQHGRSRVRPWPPPSGSTSCGCSTTRR